MLSFLTNMPRRSRTLAFGSAMHIWSDLFFALLVPLLPFIREDMGLSYTEIGLLRSVFSGASALLQVPAGLLSETFGEFWLLIWGNIWVSAGLLAMAISPLFITLLATSALGGLGGGPQHPLASSMVSRAYDDKGRSTAVGTVNFAGDIGKMLAPLVAAIAALAMGWRAILAIVGAAGLVFMFASMFVRRAVDIGRPPSAPADTTSEGSEGTDATNGASNMTGFVMLSGVGALDAATRTAALVFLTLLMDEQGMGSGQIALMLFLLYSGGAAGKYICGWLADRMGAVTLIWATKGLTAALIVASLYTPNALMIPLMIATGVGLNGTSSVLYASVANLVPPLRRARFYGFFYTTNEFGSVIAPVAYGVIADRLGLSAAILGMGAATAAILPVSLTLRKHLSQSRF